MTDFIVEKAIDAPADSAERIRAIHLRTRRALDAIYEIQFALFQGIWLGLLPPDRLQHMTALLYAAKDPHEDASWNRGGLHPWEQAAVDEFFPSGGRLLVAGAGGGREVLALAARGYAVDAFDSSPKLSARLRANMQASGVIGNVFDAGPNEVPAAIGSSYDGAIIGWGAYNHISPRAKRIAFLKRTAEPLALGGPLLLSFWRRLRAPHTYRMTAALGSALRTLRRLPPVEPGDEIEMGAFFHRFVRAEIESEFAEAGFELKVWREYPYAHAVGTRT